MARVAAEQKLARIATEQKWHGLQIRASFCELGEAKSAPAYYRKRKTINNY
jgi:hypothetical protein